jgi:hypothetical protein
MGTLDELEGIARSNEAAGIRYDSGNEILRAVRLMHSPNLTTEQRAKAEEHYLNVSAEQSRQFAEAQRRSVEAERADDERMERGGYRKTTNMDGDVKWVEKKGFWKGLFSKGLYGS